MAPRLREVIASVPEVRGVMSHVGRPDDGTDVTSFFNLEFNVPSSPMEQWRTKPVKFFGRKVWHRAITREEIQDELMEKFKEFPAVNFNFSQLIRDNVEEALSGVKGANSVKLFGNDLHVLEEAGQRVVNILEKVPGIENVGLFHIVGQPNLEIQIDRTSAPATAINVADVEAVVQVADRRPGLHPDGRGGEALRHRPAAARRPARRPRGHRPDPGRRPRPRDGKPGLPHPALRSWPRSIPHKPGASYIYRENNRRYIPIKFSVQGPRPGLGHRRGPAEGRRPEDTAPSSPTATTSTGRASSRRCRQANARLLWIVPLSIGLIMVLLYTAFSSMKDALLVMVNVVAATMGGVWAL